MKFLKPLILIIVLSLNVKSYSQEIRNSSQKIVAYIENDGKIYNASRHVIGHFEKDKILNASRHVIGYIEKDGKVLNASRHVLGYLEEDGKVLNASRHVIGYVEKGKVLNASRHTLGSIEGMDWRFAAIYFFFQMIE